MCSFSWSLSLSLDLDLVSSFSSSKELLDNKQSVSSTFSCTVQNRSQNEMVLEKKPILRNDIRSSHIRTRRIDNQNEDYLLGTVLKPADSFITADISNVITWLKCTHFKWALFILTEWERKRESIPFRKIKHSTYQHAVELSTSIIQHVTCSFFPTLAFLLPIEFCFCYICP